jgi:tRNA-Thr(GGU) m(6)t(6)A37 methyltransferase TsaA
MGKDRRLLAGVAALLVSALLGLLYVEGSKAGETQGRVTAKEPGMTSTEVFRLHPVGVVKREGDRVFLTIKTEYAPALQGIEGFSHLWVLYWFHGHDRPEERATLKVHPRRDPSNPLTGVFATRAPVRPNLIGLTACRLVKLRGNVLEVADLDALDGSPILDLKPYIPEGDSIPGASTPEWVKKLHRQRPGE